jgi:AraC-like DNA-binding protein
VPDGCVDIIFIYNDTEYLVELLGSPLSQKTVEAYPQHHYFGVRLKPGMFLDLYDASLAEIADSQVIVTAGNVTAGNARWESLAALPGTQTLEERIALFLREFAPQLATCAVPERVQLLLGRINSTKGSVSTAQLASDLCYSERQMRRIVSAAMGIGPKTLCRIVRFQHAMHHMLAAPQAHNLCHIENLGYADQAHFQREFKEFTGLSPQTFAKRYA